MESEIISVSPHIESVKNLITKVAAAEAGVVITGETGTGKELVAQNLYRQSNRNGKPFIKVNCAAMPDTLLESEMFGYERGAFTGAYRRTRGKFEQAHGGVLFLDEIGDMPLRLQAKLLHVLQDGAYTPIGSNKTLKSDAWVIAATNKELEDCVMKGSFREDLYYRLNTIRIHIEPLRNRKEDIPCLVKHFSEKYTAQFNGKNRHNVNDHVIDRFMNNKWPGNVRELQNEIKRFMILGDNNDNFSKIPDTKLNKTSLPIEIPREISPGIAVENRQELPFLSFKKFKKSITNRIEKEVITYALNKTGWNQCKASRLLDINLTSLRGKIADLKIKEPPIHSNISIEFPNNKRVNRIVSAYLNEYVHNEHYESLIDRRVESLSVQ
jgi:two-component system response regulator AtoC